MQLNKNRSTYPSAMLRFIQLQAVGRDRWITGLLLRQRHQPRRFVVPVVSTDDDKTGSVRLSVALVVLAQPDRAQPLAARGRGDVPGRDTDATALGTGRPHRRGRVVAGRVY